MEKQHKWIKKNKARIEYWIIQHNKAIESGRTECANFAKLYVGILANAIIHDTIHGLGIGVAWRKVPDKERWIVEIGNTEGIGDTLLNAYLDALFPEGLNCAGNGKE